MLVVGFKDDGRGGRTCGVVFLGFFSTFRFLGFWVVLGFLGCMRGFLVLFFGFLVFDVFGVFVVMGVFLEFSVFSWFFEIF